MTTFPKPNQASTLTLGPSPASGRGKKRLGSTPSPAGGRGGRQAAKCERYWKSRVTRSPIVRGCTGTTYVCCPQFAVAHSA